MNNSHAKLVRDAMVEVGTNRAFDDAIAIDRARLMINAFTALERAEMRFFNSVQNATEPGHHYPMTKSGAKRV